MFVFCSLMFIKPFNTTKFDGVNFYQTVGLDTAATQKDIKKSYVRFLKQKKNFENPSNATLELWEKTEQAYAILGNEYSRALYDFFGIDFINITDFRVAGYQSDEAIEALIKMLGKAPPEIEKYGGMVYYPVEFTLEDFMFGAKRTVTTVHTLDCECPDGTVSCNKCQRQPILELTETHELVLPKGAYEFHRIVGRGYGDAASTRAASDIVFVATSTKHDVFERDGRDLKVTLNVTLAEVIEEKVRVIKGLDGSDVEIPLKNVQNLMIKRIPGHGLPDFFNNKQRGDLVVTFNLLIPESLTEEQRSLISQLLPEDNSNYDFSAEMKENL